MSTGVISEALKRFPWQDVDTHSAAYLAPAVMALAEPLDSSTRVLDIGCGTGSIMRPFLKRGCCVTGLDPSEDAIRYARIRLNDFGARVSFIHAPADDSLGSWLGNGLFDLVVSTEVIEHVYAPREFLAACHSALRPGGRLILSTPYHGYLKNLALSAANKWDFHLDPLYDGGHIKFWSRATLARLLAEFGFSNLVFRGVGRVPYLWKSMVFSATRH